MITVLVFIPQCVYEEDSCLLYGDCQLSLGTNAATFYVLQLKKTNKEKKNATLMNIGQYNNNNKPFDNAQDYESSNWLIIENKSHGLVLKKMVMEGEIMNPIPSKIIFIVYDLPVFLNTELLHLNAYESGIKHNENYFRSLIHNIKRCNSISSHADNKRSKSRIILIMGYLIALLSFVLSGFIVFLPVFKYSSLCICVHNSLESMRWALRSFIAKRTLTLKTGNYVLAAIVDIICGYVIMYWFMALISSALPSQLLLNSAEDVVHTLQELLKWLMGIPAGLKLNFAFNNMLGKFFLYHINLWWTFLVLAEPVLDFIFSIFLCFGRLGLSFQAAIFADLLALASFHVYCIYVYAARLYNLQISGLLALWRLFLGRKKNPLRQRVDSCEYTTNQLFIGTLAFTILLFLLPTTFMYYIVFATLRLLVAALAGLLIRVQLLLQVVPLYTTTMWLLKSTCVSSSLSIQVQRRKSGFPLVLSMTSVRGSLWKTIQNSVPDPVKKPPDIMWTSLLKNIITGRLIYPM